MAKKNKIIRAANFVSKAAGAAPLVDYTSSKIAKGIKKPEIRKYVKDTTTAREARNSGIALAANVASMASGGAAAGVVRAAGNARRAAKAARVVPKRFKADGSKQWTYVNNWANGEQVPIVYRKPKFTIKKYK